MIDLLFKKTKVVLDCFTHNEIAYKLFPIQEASNYMPNWWKNISNNATEKDEFVGHAPQSTMKGCTGIIDYYKLGFILPLWSDVIIQTNEEGYGYRFSDEKSKIDWHGAHQHNYTFDYHHIKFLVPWAISCKKEINFLASAPFWNLATNQNLVDNFHILSGVLNFKYQNFMNVNVFVTRKENRYELKANTPIYHLYPNTDKTIELKHHLVDKEDKVFKFTKFSFKNTYLKKIKMMKGQTEND